MTGKRLMSRPEAAEMLGICVKTLNRMWQRREIRFAQVGKRLRVPLEEIERIQRSEAPCPTICEDSPPTPNLRMTVYDFEAARAERKNRRRHRLGKSSEDG